MQSLPNEVLRQIWLSLPITQHPWDRRSAEIAADPCIVANQYIRHLPWNLNDFLTSRLNLSHHGALAAVRLLATRAGIACKVVLLQCQKLEREDLVREMLSCQPLYKQGECLAFDIETKIGRQLIEEILQTTEVSLFEEYLYTETQSWSSFFERVCSERKSNAAMLCLHTERLQAEHRTRAFAYALCLGDTEVVQVVVGPNLTPFTREEQLEIRELTDGRSIGTFDIFMYLRDNRIIDVFRFDLQQWRDLVCISKAQEIPETKIHEMLFHTLRADTRPRLITDDEIRQVLRNLQIDINHYAETLQAGRVPVERLHRMLRVGIRPDQLTEVSVRDLLSYIAVEASKAQSLSGDWLNLAQTLAAFEQ